MTAPGSLGLRIVSALVLIPVALAAVWFGGAWLALLVAAAGAAMAWEWGRLAASGSTVRQAIIVAAVVGAIAAAAFGRFDIALIVLAVGGIASALAPRDGIWTGIGTAWIAGGTIAFLWLGIGGRNALFFILAVTWASDSLAYAAGKVLGGPKLAPRLSPNKTWAGGVGGLLGAAIIGIAASIFAQTSVAKYLILGLFLGLCAQAGDLAESLAKRHFGVKDASSLIPGHGGFLDRLDGLIAVAVAAGLLTAFHAISLIEID